jgi:two-component system, chemotaxis family, protein-glutamate methylesterase/glutaminase
MALKVLVVDDTILFRKVISEAIAAIPGVEVVGSAANGKIALTRIRSLKPDIMTLDLEMPDMNGLELLQAIRDESLEVGAVLVSCLTVQGGELTMKGFDLGAFDFITKPDRGTPQENVIAIKDALTPLFKAFAAQLASRRRERPTVLPAVTPAPALRVRSLSYPVASSIVTAPAPEPASATASSPVPGFYAKAMQTEAVAIGISTGGPKALTDMIPSLPGKLGVPVFIVQHMPPIFTASLAATLDRRSALRVKEAENDEKVQPDTVYIAPGGRQMKIVASADGRSKLIRITDDPPENNCRPAVDYLFRSIAQQYQGRATGVIMTGMGSDGSTGIRLMKRNGAHIIAQDEASCVVFGMPKAAIATGVVDVVAPLHGIAGEITKALNYRPV